MWISDKYKEYFPITDGKFPIKYPSITKVINDTADKTHLEKWRERVGNDEADRIMKESAQVGSDLHRAIENHFLSIEQPDVLKTTKGFRIFSHLKKRLDMHSITPIGIEVPMKSDKLKIQGRCDFICILDGSLVIIDWKSVKNTRPREWLNDYFLQLMAYAVCFLEHTNVKVDHVSLFLSNGYVNQYEEEIPNTNLLKELIERRNTFEKNLINNRAP